MDYNYIQINSNIFIIDNLRFLYYELANNIINFGFLMFDNRIAFLNDIMPEITNITNITTIKKLNKYVISGNVIINNNIIKNYYKKNKINVPKFTPDENITWICANYNNEKYINECLNSIKKQKGNWNCIITDDCSTDNSYETIKNIIKDDNRFCLKKNEQNLGYVNTIKNMMDLSKNDIICIIDPDDILYNEATEEILKAYMVTNAGCILTNFCNFFNNLQTYLGIGNEHLNNMKKVNDYYITNNILLTRVNFQHIRTFRKSVAKHVDIFNHKEFPYTEDKDFFYRMEEICDVYFINKPLIKKRIHNESLMGNPPTALLSTKYEYKAKVSALLRRNN